jgi:hypothetical protein
MAQQAPPMSDNRPPSTVPAGAPCPSSPPCGSSCSNTPFAPTDCWTTAYWPAKFDIIVKPTNLLYCNGGAYALCFFSGPPSPTGQNPGNKPLPCVLQGSVANCTCQAYTSGAYFVDINGILNQGAYFQAVNQCGADGSRCANLETCGARGDKPGCSGYPQATVCQYVKNQNPTNPKVSLIPKADLISTFSFAMSADYRQGSTPCSGLYTGCMTAPCFFPSSHGSTITNGEPIQCQCPVAYGNYQVGQSNQVCAIPSSGSEAYVWSASFNVYPLPPPSNPAATPGSSGKP